MNGSFGNWKQHRGLGGTVSSPLGGWSGALFANGARIFVTPAGEVVSEEASQRILPTLPIGAGPLGALTYGYVGPFGEVAAEDVVTSSAKATGSQKLSDTILELAPAVSTVIEATQDPYRRAAVTQARLENLQAGLSPFSRQARINVKEAKAQAALARLGLKQESVIATRQWRGLGQTASVVGIGVGLAIAFFILTKALKK